MAITKIKKISSETLEKIKQKSAQFLPNNPSARGMTADQIKRAFYSPITEAGNSLAAEVDRVVDEANDAIESNEEAIAKNAEAIEKHTKKLELHDSVLSTQGAMISDNLSKIKTNEDNIHAHNQWLEDLQGADEAIDTRVTALSAKVSGNASSYVISTFYRFVNEFLAYGSTDGVDVSDMVTGSNILITEEKVPDFWFEKTTDDSRADSYTPAGSETAISLVVKVVGVVVGVCHILETDYTVIEGHTISAQKAAEEAMDYADDAKETATNLKGDFEEYVQSLLGTIEGELEGIIAIQNRLIRGDV